jgi:hypothetical protein
MIVAGSTARVAQKNNTKQSVLPAPMAGMDARLGAGADDPNVCLWAINMVPSEYGYRTRQGYREWQIGLPSEVRTVVPYEGLVATDLDDKIFAVCAEGIYDVSGQAGIPVQKFAFADNGDDAGWGVFTHYIDGSGDDMVYYADGANGLFLYTPATDTWAQATGITAAPGSLGTLDVTNIVYIVSHKLRLWVIEKDDNKAWYLPVGSFIGEATEFFFGSKFKHGGDLVGLFNWTVDGGAGRDDFLVALSRGGDVLPFSGDDPSSDMTWENIGVFFVGRVPRGNRVASEYGGELYLLSSLGIMSMGELVSGSEPEDPTRASIGQKISRLVRLDMRDYSRVHGWNIKFMADQATLIVNTPLRSDGGYRQYVMNTTNHAWGLWRDIPYVCGESYDGDLLVGDPTGRVLRMDQTVDNVPENGGTGDDIRWFVLSAFNFLDAPAVNKRVKFIRPNFSTVESAPSVECYAYYDYFTAEPLSPVGAPSPVGGSLWDTALWDADNWSSTTNMPFHNLNGAWGMGRTVAVAMTGRSRGICVFVSWDIMWDVGGFL